jgi:hypothetical protein
MTREAVLQNLKDIRELYNAMISEIEQIPNKSVNRMDELLTYQNRAAALSLAIEYLT